MASSMLIVDGTGAATVHGNSDASKSVMVRVALQPRLTQVQKRSRPTPYGETTPMPLMTTRAPVGIEDLEKNHGLVRRHVELAPAACADDVVVDPDEVVAKLPEHRAVAFVGAGRDAIFFRPPDPSHLVLVAMAALRAGICRRLGLGPLVK